jgi:hypothetical protein
MKWCCLGFEGNYEMFGQRGLSVLAQKEDLGIQKPAFFMQVRAVSAEDQSRLQGLPSDIPFSLVTQIGIRFCPWCGKNLQRFYGKAIDSLHRPGSSLSY